MHLRPGLATGTGTYSVSPNCSRNPATRDPGQRDLHLQFIVSQSGNKIRIVVIDPGIGNHGRGERLRLRGLRNYRFRKSGPTL